MDERPFDEDQPLDAIVGLPLESVEAPPSLPSGAGQVYVSVSGDALHASWAMGLEDDVRLLGRAFAAGGASLAREMIDGRRTRSSDQSRSPDQYEGVDVALHGLGLDSGDEDELRDLIRMLVGERMARGLRP
jgi:hypothetical protein